MDANENSGRGMAAAATTRGGRSTCPGRGGRGGKKKIGLGVNPNPNTR